MKQLSKFKIKPTILKIKQSQRWITVYIDVVSYCFSGCDGSIKWLF